MKRERKVLWGSYEKQIRITLPFDLKYVNFFSNGLLLSI